MVSAAYIPTAYTDARIGLKSERAREYELIARITRRLRDAQSNLPYSFPELVAALDENRRLWNIFAVDVSGSENKLSAELRRDISQLANFMVAHTQRVLSNTADVHPIIEINLAIMKGLSNNEVVA